MMPDTKNGFYGILKATTLIMGWKNNNLKFVEAEAKNRYNNNDSFLIKRT